MREIHGTAKVSEGVKFFTRRVVIGARARIDEGCILTGDIEIGEGVHLAPYCVLHGNNGIRIGDYSGFSAFTVFHSTSDDFSGRSMFGPTVPDDFKTLNRGRLTIGEHVLGGTRVTFMPNITVGDGVAIGAHSFVKTDCKPWTIYAGVPAKEIKPRDKQSYLSLLKAYEGE